MSPKPDLARTHTAPSRARGISEDLSENRMDASAALRALAGVLAEQLVEIGAVAGDSMPWRSLEATAEKLGWTREHLRDFCEEHGVPLSGTRKAVVVDVDALNQALRSSATARADVGRTVRRTTLAPANDAPRSRSKPADPPAGIDEADARALAASGIRVAPPPTRKAR
jgi:hypothetical protein